MNFIKDYLVYYLLVVNFISGFLFFSDKLKAKKNARRVPEKNLHIWEFLGGFIANLLLMYTIRHKNQKASYYVYTYLALFAWVILFYLLFS